MKVPIGIGSDDEELKMENPPQQEKKIVTKFSSRSHRESAIQKLASAVNNIFYSNAESTAGESVQRVPWYVDTRTSLRHSTHVWLSNTGT